MKFTVREIELHAPKGVRIFNEGYEFSHTSGVHDVYYNRNSKWAFVTEGNSFMSFYNSWKYPEWKESFVRTTFVYSPPADATQIVIPRLLDMKSIADYFRVITPLPADACYMSDQAVSRVTDTVSDIIRHPLVPQSCVPLYFTNAGVTIKSSSFPKELVLEGYHVSGHYGYEHGKAIGIY